MSEKEKRIAKTEKLKLGPQTLLYPMPGVLVGAIVDAKPNFMTAVWCGIAVYNPCPILDTLKELNTLAQG
jgi:hypothetical protein